MTSSGSSADPSASAWFASRPALPAGTPAVPVVVPVAAPVATIGGPREAGTPIYDSLVAAYGDPFSRQGPTRARLPRVEQGTHAPDRAEES
ncbi:hypothetical protein [Streptomyces sp. CB01881]|uniref:hypothetical protein n=1 Tax=Streptomyces sp. CB01881 TaxID=2078691 RepID=UPI0011DF6E5F|nr:hypothetical protein [Streptomyces sp. CB01881]TYC73832.1 hypothetical protein EH183_17570 [Streptomyces sp. CB01881]